MKKVMAFALALVMVLALCSCGGGSSNSNSQNTSAPAENTAGTTTGGDSHDDWVKLNLTFATYLTEQNPCQGNITTLQKYLDELMPGYITIETYANNTLLKGADIMDGLLNGTCDIGLVQPDYTPTRFPLCQIFSYPGIAYNSAEVATRVFHEWGRTSGADELSDVVFLMGLGSGPYCIFTNEPVTSMADLKGKQIRAGAINAFIIADYGAVPVTMDISEIYEAMRSSLIDGVYSMYGALAFQNMDDVGKYALVTPLNSNPSFFAMNKDTFAMMPASQQEVFMEACDKAFEEYTTKYQDGTLNSGRVAEFALATDRTFLEGDMLAEFQAANAHLMDDLIADLDSQGIDGTGTYEMAKSLADKYNQQMTWEDYKACFGEDADPSNN